MSIMTYKEYLLSEHWRLLRGAKLQISSRCEICKSREELEVHHKVRRGSWYNSKIQDLQTLCHHHHMMEHAKGWEELPDHQKPKPPPAWVPVAVKPPYRPRKRLVTGESTHQRLRRVWLEKLEKAKIEGDYIAGR